MESCFNKIIDNLKEFLKNYISFIVIIIVVILVRCFIITPGIVNGESMENTLFDGDFVLVNKIGLLFGIDRFDIVVVKYKNETIIKRVIGLPLETVSYANDVLYVNGKEVNTPINFEATNDFTLEAGSDEFIVLGDNRDVSKDSRLIGPIKRDDIKGKVNFILFPFKDFGKLK